MSEQISTRIKLTKKKYFGLQFYCDFVNLESFLNSKCSLIIKNIFHSIGKYIKLLIFFPKFGHFSFL